jgi:hypothetical protein
VDDAIPMGAERHGVVPHPEYEVHAARRNAAGLDDLIVGTRRPGHV